MNTGDEHTALLAHVQAYQNWSQAWTTLHEVVAAADPEPKNLNPDLQNAVAAEFRLSREVVQTAIDYANVCPRGGPDTHGLIGPSFVVALVGVVRRELGETLTQDLKDLAIRHDRWLVEAAAWTPSPSESSAPARPPTPHSVHRVLQAARDFDEHRRERAHETFIEGFGEAGRKQGFDVQEETTVYADGSTVRSSEIRFDRTDSSDTEEPVAPEMEPGGGWPRTKSSNFFAHQLDCRHGPWRVMRRDRKSVALGEEISSHWRGTTAFEAAHRARQNIDDEAVIDVVEWRTRGWVLRDTMPALFAHETDQKSGAEVVFGYREEDVALGENAQLISAHPVALLLPFQIGWEILLSSPDDPERFYRPKKMKEALYATRSAAILGARRLTHSE
ncbi:hypothetical protein [Rhodococcoides fascians]|uniref:hypothetical protein n=1 Tax=Rhodococcoides fascians TaxID=1828 RepID=UPI003671C09A